MPRGTRHRRPHWMRERSASPRPSAATAPAAPAAAATQPPSHWGLPDWLENWLHCRRSLGTAFFALGLLAYCARVWTPIEDWLARLIPPRHGEFHTDSLKFIVGPTIVVLGSAAFTSGARPSTTFNTAQINGVNAACGAFVGQHLLGGSSFGATASSADQNNIVAALAIAPAVLSFLAAFFDYDHARASPVVLTAILGGACLPAWSLVLTVAGLPLDGLVLVDLSLFTMAAAMSECYLRKFVIRALGPDNVLTPLATQMMTDLGFSWIADSHLVELNGITVAAAAAPQTTPAFGRPSTPPPPQPPPQTACQIVRFANVIAILILLGQTIVWMEEKWKEQRRWRRTSLLGVGVALLLLQIAYVNELGPTPLIYRETDVVLSTSSRND